MQSLVLEQRDDFQSDKPESHCFYSYKDSLATHYEIEVEIQSEDIILAGRLFLPDTTGSHPVAILMQGGGSNVRMLRATPNYFGPRLAHCGIASIAYDKRGTGDSGGDYSKSTFDDFVLDAGNIARFLSSHDYIDASKIGMVGFSQGGRLGPVVAVRYEEISYVVSVSGPMTRPEVNRLFALENSFLEAGVAESQLEHIMPLWQTHFEAIASSDEAALKALDEQLKVGVEDYHHSLLPPRSTHLPQTAIYNSIGRDYAAELDQLDVPWYSLYGEKDIVVPVEESVAILHERMKAGGHEDYEVNILPASSHSFMHTETNEPIYFEEIIVDWMLLRLFS